MFIKCDLREVGPYTFCCGCSVYRTPVKRNQSLLCKSGDDPSLSLSYFIFNNLRMELYSSGVVELEVQWTANLSGVVAGLVDLLMTEEEEGVVVVMKKDLRKEDDFPYLSPISDFSLFSLTG